MFVTVYSYQKELQAIKQELQQEKMVASSSIEKLTKENDQLRNEKLTMKDEWAELYATMKAEIEGYRHDVELLNNENDKLLKLTDKSTTQSRKSEMETMKKLSKRELECSALWDTIRDIYKGHANPADKGSLEKLFSVRALEVKAKRKVFK